MKPKLLLCASLLLLASASAPAADITPAKSLAPILAPYVESGSLAGAVILVADKDKILDLEAVGYSDVATKTPMKPDAVFWIASMSKPITATALMILVDEGKVKLDDPVEKYLPEMKDLMVKEKGQEARKPKRPVTVRDILSHTSGMQFKSDAETPTLDRLTLKDAVASYAKTPLAQDPGTKYVYSNMGINTAGRIIEVVSGMPYEEFLDKRLFGPLGMKDTTFWPSEEQVARLAKAYKPGPKGMGLEEIKIGQLSYPLTDRKRQPMPGGGLFSTATDCARFCQMLLNRGSVNGKRVLSEAAVKELTTKQTGDMVKDQYGLGFSVGGGTFGHGGALATNMTVDPKRGLIYVYLVQHAGFPGNGREALAAFHKAAEARFAPAPK